MASLPKGLQQLTRLVKQWQGGADLRHPERGRAVACRASTRHTANASSARCCRSTLGIQYARRKNKHQNGNCRQLNKAGRLGVRAAQTKTPMPDYAVRSVGTTIYRLQGQASRGDPLAWRIQGTTAIRVRCLREVFGIICGSGRAVDGWARCGLHDLRKARRAQLQAHTSERSRYAASTSCKVGPPPHASSDTSSWVPPLPVPRPSLLELHGRALHERSAHIGSLSKVLAISTFAMGASTPAVRIRVWRAAGGYMLPHRLGADCGRPGGRQELVLLVRGAFGRP